jgi:hypothetical protein
MLAGDIPDPRECGRHNEWEQVCAAAVPGLGGVPWPSGIAGRPSPGGDIIGESFPNTPGGDEVAGGPNTRM